VVVPRPVRPNAHSHHLQLTNFYIKTLAKKFFYSSIFIFLVFFFAFPSAVCDFSLIRLQLQQLSLELISYLFGSCGAAWKSAGKTELGLPCGSDWPANGVLHFHLPPTLSTSLAGQRDIAHEKLFVFSLALIRFCKWLGIVEESRVKS